MIKMPFLIGKPKKSLRTSDTVVSNENFLDDSFASIFGDKFFWGCNSTINFIRTIVQTRSGLVLIKVGQRHGRSEKEIQMKKKSPFAKHLYIKAWNAKLEVARFFVI